MKICFVVSVYPRFHEDPEVPWLRKTVNLLRESGHEIVIYAPSFKGVRSHQIDGCPVQRFRYFFAPWESLTHDEGAPNKIHKWYYKVMILFYVFFGTLGLIRFHGKQRFDVLHVHWPAPHALFAYIAKFFCKSKIVLSFYTADVMLTKRFHFVNNVLRFFIKRADRVMAISSFSADLVKAIYNRPLSIVPYGTTVEPKVKKPDFTPSHRILSVGRMIERKGFSYLISAMPVIRKTWPDARLTIAGGGPIREQLLRLRSTLGLEDIVDLPGKIPQEALEKLFAGCQVFVLSSIVDSKGDTEGLGVVLLEAMSYFKPVIATNIGGITDIVLHDKTGLLVPQRDSQAIAEAVLEIFGDQTKAQRLAIDGYDYVQKHFSWPSVVKGFNDVYASLV